MKSNQATPYRFLRSTSAVLLAVSLTATAANSTASDLISDSAKQTINRAAQPSEVQVHGVGQVEYAPSSFKVSYFLNLQSDVDSKNVEVISSSKEKLLNKAREILSADLFTQIKSQAKKGTFDNSQITASHNCGNLKKFETQNCSVSVRANLSYEAGSLAEIDKDQLDLYKLGFSGGHIQPQYTVTGKIKQEAVEEAAHNAGQEAKFIAQSHDMEIIGIKTINGNSHSGGAPVRFEMMASKSHDSNSRTAAKGTYTYNLSVTYLMK